MKRASELSTKSTSDLGGGVRWTHLWSGQFCGADTGVVAAMLGGQQGELIGNTEYGIRGGKAVQISTLFSPTKDQLEKIQKY
jgi:hypothetical protein